MDAQSKLRALGALTLAIALPTQAANLLVNGSFESPVLEPASYTELVGGGPEGFAWNGAAFHMNGGGGSELLAGIWPSKGADGLQYGNFGNGPAYSVSQTFSVPGGAPLNRITWFDASSAVFSGGSYAVRLIRVSDGAEIASASVSIPMASEGVVPWTARSLPLPDPRPGPGTYTLVFHGDGMSGLDYLVDDVVADATPAGPSVSSDSPFIYAANGGWLHCRPSAAEGLRLCGTYLAGQIFAANLGWIDLGDGTPSGGVSYSQAAGDTGVNVAADGTLSGCAFSANTGWITFGWAAPSDPQRPRVNRATGAFGGKAFSANLGWINLGSAGLRHDTVSFPDTDFDGLPDSWELTYFGDLRQSDGSQDADGDGLSDLAEYRGGTNPRDIDSPAPASPSTLSGIAHHLFAANAGWIDARPSSRHGLRVGEFFLTGRLSSPNLGWIHVGDGTPANGHAYGNTGAEPQDYGVNVGPDGSLSGFAFAANIGWINFGWAGPNDPNRPRVDLTTGAFQGCVYAANLGWLVFTEGGLRTNSLERVDADADGIPDAWENSRFGNTVKAGIGTDADGDGQSDAAEYTAATDPTDASDFLRITSTAIDAGVTTVTLQFTSKPGRRYRIETTTNLAATGVWQDSPLGTFAPDAGARTTRAFTLTGPAATRFFRVVAEPAL